MVETRDSVLSTDWDQSGNYGQLLVFSAILIT